MATWTPDPEVGTTPAAPFVRVRLHPTVRIVMIAVGISVPLTLIVAYALIQLAFHFCWGCGGV